MDTQPLFVSPASAGRLLGVSTATVYRLVARGELPSVMVGGSRRLPLAHLLALASQPVPAA